MEHFQLQVISQSRCKEGIICTKTWPGCVYSDCSRRLKRLSSHREVSMSAPADFPLPGFASERVQCLKPQSLTHEGFKIQWKAG